MKHSEIYTLHSSGLWAENRCTIDDATCGLSTEVFLAVFLFSFIFLYFSTLQPGIQLLQQLQSKTETQLVSSFKYLFLLSC